MSGRFYAGWALVVTVALALPIGLPFLVWSSPETGPGSWAGPADAEMFGRWASTQIEGGFIPKSVEVEEGPLLRTPVSCGGPVAMHSLPRMYSARVTLRGVYGIPLASYEVTCTGWSSSGRTIGDALAYMFGALFVGAAVVSMPFAFFWLRNALGNQERFAA